MTVVTFAMKARESEIIMTIGEARAHEHPSIRGRFPYRLPGRSTREPYPSGAHTRTTGTEHPPTMQLRMEDYCFRNNERQNCAKPEDRGEAIKPSFRLIPLLPTRVPQRNHGVHTPKAAKTPPIAAPRPDAAEVGKAHGALGGKKVPSALEAADTNAKLAVPCFRALREGNGI